MESDQAARITTRLLDDLMAYLNFIPDIKAQQLLMRLQGQDGAAIRPGIVTCQHVSRCYWPVCSCRQPTETECFLSALRVIAGGDGDAQIIARQTLEATGHANCAPT